MRGRRCSFDYATIRVVPRVDREEFVNVGVILSCPSRDFLEATIELDEVRLAGFAPWVAAAEVRRFLDPIRVICAGGAQAGPIGLLPRRQRFYWLTAARSTIVQTSPPHVGLCEDPGVALERLVERMVRVPEKP